MLCLIEEDEQQPPLSLALTLADVEAVTAVDVLVVTLVAFVTPCVAVAAVALLIFDACFAVETGPKFVAATLVSLAVSLLFETVCVIVVAVFFIAVFNVVFAVVAALLIVDACFAVAAEPGFVAVVVGVDDFIIVIIVFFFTKIYL